MKGSLKHSHKKSECQNQTNEKLNKEDLLKKTEKKNVKTHTAINEEGQKILQRLRDAFASKMIKKNDSPAAAPKEKDKKE